MDPEGRLDAGDRRRDVRAVAVAASVAAGAWLAVSAAAGPVGPGPQVPVAGAFAGAGLALASRRPGLVCLAAALLAASLAQRSLAGLDGPHATGPVQATVTLVSDPRPTPGGGVSADVRLDGQRLALRAYRSAATAVQDRLLGERLHVIGEVKPKGPYEERARHRHLAGRIDVDVVVGWQPGHGVTRLANGVRRTLADGAASLPDRRRSLLAGLVLGDVRDQPPELTEAFRDAGLTHLLAVSGSDVAVVLALAAPLLSRLRLAPRLVVTLAVLGAFALVTRGEPSVLRATAMAVVAAYGFTTGRPVAGLRCLALGVTGLLLVDPLLVTAVGFQLSVAGTAGILVAARPLARALPGPRWLALPLAVTVAAQLAVAPLLVAVFGSVPLVSLPANLLAAPAAGPVKAWGLTGGFVAGLAGEPVAALLHLPSGWLLGWLDRVATVAAGLPVGDLRAAHLVSLAVSGGAMVAGQVLRSRSASASAWGARLLRAAGAVGLVGIVVAAALGPGQSSAAGDGQAALGPGTDLWQGGGAAVLVVDGRATEGGVVDGLRRREVDRVDLLVVRTTASRALAVARAAAARWPGVTVLVPSGAAGAGSGAPRQAVVPDVGSVVRVGGLTLWFGGGGDRLEVDVEVDG